MILQREVENISAEMYLDLLLKFNASEHIEDLNSFNEEEDLRSVSEDSLKDYLEKSLAMDLEKLSKMLKKSLSRGDLIKLCHFGIELANVSSSDKNKKNKRKSDSTMSGDDSGAKKKTKEPTVSEFDTFLII